MTTGFETVKLTIGHVGNDRERMPVSGESIDKGAGNAVPTQSHFDQRISVNVGFVVVVNEVVAERLAKNNPDKRNDRSARDNVRPTRR